MRPIRREEALDSYKDLVSADCSRDPAMGRTGLKALDYFFLGHRLKAKTKRHLSFADAMRSEATRGHLRELVVRYKKKPLASYKSADDLLRHMYYAFQLYYGTINQFRPLAAKWAYCTLGARVGILDFSAGWGGRALAAASLGIPYIGFDANLNLESAYGRMVEMIHEVSPTASVRVEFRPSETVDFSRYRYDLVFTSPPYFMLEEYEKMPAYAGKANFLARFFVPVVAACWKHLLPGGAMALNMPAEMYEAVRDILPPLSGTLALPLPNRHPTNAKKGHALGAEDEERHELIYVWRKGGRSKTRRRALRARGTRRIRRISRP